ncbi:hypothetical protein Pla144_36500 [Bythopirellula polymerisocia]|uniref:Uncharacterized protein n=1 Tax=Bythopirellula polymerisocia TaxID=2528003 RepID=A0A5C6CMR4_9BACT|nr:hypothetical protein Pla144_36500 [Bythopirellula polymerisocia]
MSCEPRIGTPGGYYDSLMSLLDIIRTATEFVVFLGATLRSASRNSAGASRLTCCLWPF